MKLKSLLALLPVFFSPMANADPAKFEKEIAAFEQADREHPPEKGGIGFVPREFLEARALRVLFSTSQSQLAGHGLRLFQAIK